MLSIRPFLFAILSATALDDFAPQSFSIYSVGCRGCGTKVPPFPQPEPNIPELSYHRWFDEPTPVLGSRVQYRSLLRLQCDVSGALDAPQDPPARSGRGPPSDGQRGPGSWRSRKSSGRQDGSPRLLFPGRPSIGTPHCHRPEEKTTRKQEVRFGSNAPWQGQRKDG